jgi:hypothetical protein
MDQTDINELQFKRYIKEAKFANNFFLVMNSDKDDYIERGFLFIVLEKLIIQP